MARIVSDYLARAFRDQDEIIGKAKQALAGVEFDAFAVRGVSGLLIGPLLAHALNKGLRWLALICIRGANRGILAVLNPTCIYKDLKEYA